MVNHVERMRWVHILELAFPECRGIVHFGAAIHKLFHPGRSSRAVLGIEVPCEGWRPLISFRYGLEVVTTIGKWKGRKGKEM